MFIISLIGSSKVGKTSLFNKLINNNDFLNINNLFDFSYGLKYFKKKFFIFIDNINFDIFNKKNFNNSNIYFKLYKKFILNLKNSDLICLLVDSHLNILDKDIYFYKNIVKKFNNNIVLIVSKIDLLNANNRFIIYKFYSLGIKYIFTISIYKKYMLKDLLNNLYLILIKNFKNNDFFKYLLKYCVNLNKYDKLYNLYLLKNNKNLKCINIVILGKTNVGKSTLLNNICKCNCSFVSSFENTTKEFIFYNLVFNNIKFLISDSPGISKMFFNKYYSFFKFFKKINIFNIILFTIDINIGLTKYDLYLIKFLLVKGKIVFIIFNKCEKLNKNDNLKYEKYIKKKYGFIRNIFIFFISALNLKEKFLFKLFKLINKNYNKIFNYNISTYKINKILKLALKNFSEKNNFNNLIKLKYAHIGGYNPLTIIIHGKKVNYINLSYKNYLINFYTRYLKIFGYNINIRFKECYNPYISIYKKK